MTLRERLAALDGKSSGGVVEAAYIVDGYVKVAREAVAALEERDEEMARLRDKVATYIEDARYYHRQWRRQGELNLDAVREIARLRELLARTHAAWMLEASQGDGIMEDHTQVDLDCRAALAACRERDEEIEKLGESRDHLARMHTACNEREQKLIQIRDAAAWFVDVFDDDNAWIENSDGADYGLDVLRATLADTESQVAYTSSQVSTERDEEYTCKTGA